MTRGLRHATNECSVDGCDSKPRGLGLCDKHYRRWQRNGHTGVTVLRGLSDVDRFWAHVSKTASCWEWQSEMVKGYGRFKRADGSRIMAHRYSYELVIAPIPAGLTIDHLCRNTICVNPAHLEPVTMRENIQRANR